MSRLKKFEQHYMVDRPVKKTLKQKAEAAYATYLGDVTKIMGGSTALYSNRILEVGQILFGRRFKGVFPRDEYESVSKQKEGFFIVNLDVSSLPGSHWVAIADGLLYDSFGRTNLGFNLETTEDDAEQCKNEENCGHRCLAWLCVAYAMGSEAAKLV